MPLKTKDDFERRFFKTEVRLAPTDAGGQRIVGHGAVFNQLSEDLGGFQEMIMPGAFSDTLVEDVRGLFNHDPNLILGRTGSGTMVIDEDLAGLRYQIELPETQYARDLAVSIERGDVDQSSFGFRVIEESWRLPDEKRALPLRVLHKVRLYDTGPVTFPAYPTTSVNVSMRALDRARTLSIGEATDADIEAEERTAGRLDALRRKLELASKL